MMPFHSTYYTIFIINVLYKEKIIILQHMHISTAHLFHSDIALDSYIICHNITL